MGIYPVSFLEVMSPSVESLIADYQIAREGAARPSLALLLQNPLELTAFGPEK
jgi:hypothetical protein